MAKCLNCGQEAGYRRHKRAYDPPKKYCGHACRLEWWKTQRSNFDFEGIELSRFEIEERQEHAQKARFGDAPSQQWLRKNYNITGLWNPKTQKMLTW